MSENETDIYDDLPDFTYGDKFNELQSLVNTLIEKNDKLYARLLQTSKEKEEFEEKCNALSLNISILLKTAQSEISRKDRIIKNLRQELDESNKRLKNGKVYTRGNYKSSQITNVHSVERKSKELNSKELVDARLSLELDDRESNFISRNLNFSPGEIQHGGICDNMISRDKNIQESQDIAKMRAKQEASWNSAISQTENQQYRKSLTRDNEKPKYGRKEGVDKINGKSNSPTIQDTSKNIKDVIENTENCQETQVKDLSSLKNTEKSKEIVQAKDNKMFVETKMKDAVNKSENEDLSRPAIQKKTYKTLFSERMAKRIGQLADIEACKINDTIVPVKGPEELQNPIKTDVNRCVPKRSEEMDKNTEISKRVTAKRTRCTFNPISNNCGINAGTPPSRIMTRSQVSLQPPQKKVKLQPVKNKKQKEVNKCSDSMLLDIFGSPVKWVDSSLSEDEEVNKIDLSSPTVYEDSCSAQIENTQFTEKTKTIVSISHENEAPNEKSKNEEADIIVDDKDKRPFQNLSKNETKSLFSPEKSEFNPSIQSTSPPPLVFEPSKPNPPVNPKYEDTFMGQFEDTTQFITALTKVENKISPLNTPCKVNESKVPVIKISPLTINQPATESKEDEKNPSKPINVLKPRKTPRVVMKPISSKTVNKTFSLKDSFVSEQEKKVMNLKNTENEKVLQVFGSSRGTVSSKAPLEKMKWVLKPLKLEHKITIRRESLNIDFGGSAGNKELERVKKIINLDNTENEKTLQESGSLKGSKVSKPLKDMPNYLPETHRHQILSTSNFANHSSNEKLQGKNILKMINKQETRSFHSTILLTSPPNNENPDFRMCKGKNQKVPETKKTQSPPKNCGNSLKQRCTDCSKPDVKTTLDSGAKIEKTGIDETVNTDKSEYLSLPKKQNLEIDMNKKLPLQSMPVMLIRNNRKIQWSNVDNPGKLIVTRRRPINFSMSS